MWQAAEQVLLMGVIDEVHLRWYDTHTKFHEDSLRHSGNIKVITYIVWEVAVLALLMGRTYDICRLDDLGWHDMCTKFYDDWSRNSSNIERITSGCNVGIMSLRWPQMHDVHTKSHDDQFRHSSNGESFTTVWDAIVLVLWTRGLYGVRRWNGLRLHYTMFHDDR
jgi:hypothetical protein